MKFREHRGGYTESMETCVELNTKEEFLAHLEKVVRKCTQDAATIRFSDLERVDARNGWRTFYVILDGSGPIGMIDGPPPTSWWPPIKFESGVKSKRSCNRHSDCEKADVEAKARGAYAASHCHDDECEDCFGC